ncbi:MAG TPA: alpha/beta hydrolase-fold protein [Aggregatilineaceae bacterium]|nr:alpha/beta hydrolase-fold protein [Aggregatilineaceae bacterium]
MVTIRWISTLILMIMLLACGVDTQAQQETPCTADAGTVITRTMQSEAIGQEKAYNVYLPPNWCKLDDLPLLVMLHGVDGDYTDWVDEGRIDEAADALIQAGEIEPLIILMPDGDDSFYINGEYGDYETYIVSELVGLVDQEFPTAGTRETRFIGGLSMGGYGALYLGMRHPDLFSAIGAHSPAIFRPNQNEVSQYLYGVNAERYEDFDIVSLIERDGWPDGIRVFTDVGNEDGLLGAFFRLNDVLFTRVNVADYQVHIWPGTHDWAYWSAHAGDYLRFYMLP